MDTADTSVWQRAILLLAAVFVGSLCVPASAQNSAAGAAAADFDWISQRTSEADVLLPEAIEFLHGSPSLSRMETDAYRKLIDTAADQYARLWQQAGDDEDPTAVWEAAFYRFAEVRRMAFESGNLQLGGSTDSDAPARRLADPFRDADAPALPLNSGNRAATAAQNSEPVRQYDLLKDIRRHPEEFVGRPIVLTGYFEPASSVELQAEAFGTFAEPNQPVRLVRGLLRAGDQQQPVAVVDTQSLNTPGADARGLDSWPPGATAVPVLVKGWVVKLWDSQPLIYCESVRELSPQPHTDLIRRHTVAERRILPEETWLYYETLRQMQFAPATQQQRQARDFLRQRIDDLITEIRVKAAQELAEIRQAADSGPTRQAQLDERQRRLQNLVNARLQRYQRYRRDPASFQTYVDLFQHSDEWQGQLVTLRGHVRHVVSYPGDKSMFGGRMLHELWLFTDDSQHNPAVIVTPDLPTDFPVGASVVDRVTVTGCYFKRYVYGSQDNHRVAPLVLAGRIRWEPTLDQLKSLTAAGHLSAGSPLAQQAKQTDRESFNGPVLLVISVLAAMAVMIAWGRSQRERRDRRRLLHRVNEDPAFESADLQEARELY